MVGALMLLFSISVMTVTWFWINVYVIAVLINYLMFVVYGIWEFVHLRPAASLTCSGYLFYVVI